MLRLVGWATQQMDAWRQARPGAGLDAEHRLDWVVRRQHRRQQGDSEEEAENGEPDDGRPLAHDAAKRCASRRPAADGCGRGDSAKAEPGRSSIVAPIWLMTASPADRGSRS